MEMSNLGKCISCGKIISGTDAFCMYCGEKQYINYPGGIKIKKTTTTLVGFIAVVIILGIGGYFFIKNNTAKKAIAIAPPAVTQQNSAISKEGNLEKAKDNTYVIKDSDRYPITQETLKGLTKYELLMARNEILARHGYVYKSEPYKSYFNSKSWYKPNPKFKGQKADLSPLERHNVKEIMEAEGTKPEANYDSDYHGK